MPITKERLISILRVAQNFEGEIQRLCLTINNSAAAALNGISDHTKALEHILTITSNPDLYIGHTDYQILANERAHWRANFRRAERDRRYQEGKRRELGIPQALQAFDLDSIPSVRATKPPKTTGEDRTFLPYDPIRAAQSSQDHEQTLSGMRAAIESECAGLLSSAHYALAFRDNDLGEYFYGCTCDPALRAPELAQIVEHLKIEQSQSAAETFDPQSLIIAPPGEAGG